MHVVPEILSLTRMPDRLPFGGLLSCSLSANAPVFSFRSIATQVVLSRSMLYIYLSFSPRGNTISVCPSPCHLLVYTWISLSFPELGVRSALFLSVISFSYRLFVAHRGCQAIVPTRCFLLFHPPLVWRLSFEEQHNPSILYARPYILSLG
jgi:hypothetical protein